MKDQSKIIIAVIAACVALGVLFMGLMYIGASNSEIALRNQYNAQVKSNESSFDKTWKTISQEAQIAQTERESFKKTYSEIMESTQGVAGKGSLASFFSQAKIDVSPELFGRLMTTIESQRESFHRDQLKLLQIVKQHDDVRTKFPSSLFVGGRPALEAIVITSDKTKDVFATGSDNDVELFK